ncbi:hypothetical protein SDRG_01637 [Saprolegnia diclina VS20]|uniref:Uncharacterized protein n=1 Tax=Saprolegnia diclina (strain VS20) TaxID=1156394 RepID=T0QU06_SAPDV|nr:hypothetical protein SDRG_01637 [Saprolegnia diclina VS20]EQC41679.1 hypothetical protein SDRG_01637 [Saprolegnia diclina VS20]|eukprot:XP_008605393.1 hypothetical protein SDRG_01637 [Saprolegnia diclina VS20]
MTAPEAMAVPGRHARELAALRAEYEEHLASLRTDCQMQLAAMATTLRAEHQANIAAVTTTLQQEHQEALATTAAALCEEHSTKETALTSQLAMLAAERDVSLERARVLDTRSEGLRRDLHTLAKLNHRLQTTIATTATSQKSIAAATDVIATKLAGASKDDLVASLQAKLELTSSDLAASKATEGDNTALLREATSRIMSMGDCLHTLHADVDGHAQRALRDLSAMDDALVSHPHRIDQLVGQLAVAKFAACSAQLVHEATIQSKDETICRLNIDLVDCVEQTKMHKGIVDQLQRDMVTKDELLTTRDDQVRHLLLQLDDVKAQLSATTTANPDPRTGQVVSIPATEKLTRALQLARNKIQATVTECRETLAIKETSLGRHEDTYDVRHHHPRISVHRVNTVAPRRC